METEKYGFKYLSGVQIYGEIGEHVNYLFLKLEHFPVKTEVKMYTRVHA